LLNSSKQAITTEVCTDCSKINARFAHFEITFQELEV
jgi:hypothetical protein